jgi:hypothetical protein
MLEHILRLRVSLRRKVWFPARPASTRRLCGFQEKRNDMQLPAYFFRAAEPPSQTFRLPAEMFRHGFDDAGHIDYGMALKYLGQPVCQVTGEAFARALAQLKSQFGACGGEGAAYEAYVIRAFLPPAEKRVKKFFRSFRRKDAVKKRLIKFGHGFPLCAVFRKFRVRCGLRPQAV